MKPITTFIYVLLLSTTGQLEAQDLSALDTVVYYSMINTSDDLQGNYDTIRLTNSPFQGDDGVYCNGIYIGNFDPDASFVETPSLSEVYDSTFAISMEFRIDEAPEQFSPIIICGGSWRYLGIMVRDDSTFYYVFNGNSVEIPMLKVKMGDWQTATCLYTMADSTASFWIDGQQVAFAKGALNRPDNDSHISNTHGGFGNTMLGYIRNLIVYSDRGLISGTTPLWTQSTARIYPNPTAQELMIEDAQYTSWSIYNLNGVEFATGKNDSQQRVNVATLPSGSYILTLLNEHQQIVHRERFQKI